jgi:hypothetical protein
LRDVFQGVIVPRAENTTLRISRYLMSGLWDLWPILAYRFFPQDEDKREDFLGTFAPFQLVLLLVVWVTLLVLGWGLLFYGIRGELRPANLSFGACLYFAGESLLTIGYGDIVAMTAAARTMALLSAASGLGTFAIVISYLFAIFGAFQQRETFVVTIGARAGVPPSGVGLMLVHGYAGMREDLATVFREGQAWTARVMESHLAYPILTLFRSSHDYESWVGTLGTLLDASALVMTTLDPDDMRNPQSQGQARIMYELGRHLTHDFATYFRFFDSVERTAGIDRSEFETACDHLERASYKLRNREAAWSEFSKLRSTYSAHLNTLARWLAIPPVQWVSDRSLLAGHAKAG